MILDETPSMICSIFDVKVASTGPQTYLKRCGWKFCVGWWSEYLHSSHMDPIGEKPVPRMDLQYPDFILEDFLGHFGIFRLTIGTLGSSLGPPWGTLGPRPLKNTKNSVFGTSFWRTVWVMFSFFWGIFLKCVFGRLTDHPLHDFGIIYEQFLKYFPLPFWSWWKPWKIQPLQCENTVFEILRPRILIIFCHKS